MGTFGAMQGVGFLIGSYLSGVVSYLLGYAVTFALSLGTLVLSLFIFEYFWKLERQGKVEQLGVAGV